jgi:hypothetical protein
MKNCNPQAKAYLERPADYVCNSTTGRWVLRTSAIGKKILGAGGAPPAPAPYRPAAAKKTKTLDDFKACNKDVTVKDLQAMLDAHGVVYKKKAVKQYYCDLVDQLIRDRRGGKKIVGSIKKTSPTRKSPTRKSPTRKSPTRKSPTRKSPTRKSPTRKSPAKKSPARKSPQAFTDDVSGMSREEIIRKIKDCLKIR